MSRFQRYGNDLDTVEGVSKVANYVWDADLLTWVRDTGGGGGGGGGTVELVTESKRYDQASSTVLYVGEAVPGSATSSPLWKIAKITVDASGNPLTKLFANLGAQNQIWDNRASLSYS